MIFSLANTPNEVTLPILENTDVICFFSHGKGVKVHSEFWFEILLTSLKMKRSVLILTGDFKELSAIDFSQRWQIGEASLWFAPRAHSVLLATYPDKRPFYQNLISFLEKSK